MRVSHAASIGSMHFIFSARNSSDWFASPSDQPLEPVTTVRSAAVNASAWSRASSLLTASTATGTTSGPGGAASPVGAMSTPASAAVAKTSRSRENIGGELIADSPRRQRASRKRGGGSLLDFQFRPHLATHPSLSPIGLRDEAGSARGRKQATFLTERWEDARSAQEGALERTAHRFACEPEKSHRVDFNLAFHRFDARAHLSVYPLDVASDALFVMPNRQTVVDRIDDHEVRCEKR